MSEKEKKGPLEAFCDDMLDQASSVFGLLDGAVDDGPPKKKKEVKNNVHDDDERADDDGTDDDDDGADDEPTPAVTKKKAGAAKGKQDAQGFLHTLRIEHVTGGRGPGRPKGSTAPKKTDGDGA